MSRANKSLLTHYRLHRLRGLAVAFGLPRSGALLARILARRARAFARSSFGRPAAAWLFLLVVLAGAQSAFAERADREQPINIESDRMSADDAKRTAVFEGRVVLTQGSLEIHADRIEVRQDRDGFQYAVATGNPVTFRQKREGADEYVEGQAERVEYDGKADQVQLFNRARLKRDSGDDVSGNYISYNSRTEEFSVRSAKDAPAEARGRVRAVIMPRKKDAGANPATSTPVPTANRNK